MASSKAESPEHHHALIEASKRAFTIGEQVVADPMNLVHDPAAFLTSSALEGGCPDRHAAGLPYPLPRSPEGDTIWMGAIDKDGLAVSYIQSVFWAFGSGCVLPATGIHWHNRGTAFSLDPASRNPLQPGRKPFHTLNPPWRSSTTGGSCPSAPWEETQPQVLAQIFTRYATFGMGLADAVDAPRWLLDKGRGAAPATLRLESRFDPGFVEASRPSAMRWRKAPSLTWTISAMRACW